MFRWLAGRPAWQAWTITALALLIAFGAGASTSTEEKSEGGGEVAATTTEEAEPAADEPEGEPEPEPEPEPVPDPDGDYQTTCDYLLGDFSGGPQGLRFVAGGNVENTGNIGIVAEVRARWTLLGGEPVRESKRVRVRVGGEREVQITVPATQDQIDAHRSADGNCKTTVAIVDTFGSARP